MPEADSFLPVIVVSTGRTGTRSLAQFFDASYGEVDARHCTPRSTLINLLANAHLAHCLPAGTTRFAWNLCKKQHWHPAGNKRVYLDSNNHLYAICRELRQWYPGLRVVHVVRDPRTYVPSHLRWAHQRPKSYLANFILPFWQPNPFLVGSTSFAEWRQMDQFSRFCWIWSFKNRWIEDSMRDDREDYLCLRFEDLLHYPENLPTLRRLSEFVGLPEPDEDQARNFPASNRSRAGTEDRRAEWSDWPAERCRRLARYCQPLMEQYGYGTEPEWTVRLQGE